MQLLPHWMRQDVDNLGSKRLQELRMRIGKKPELILPDKTLCLGREISPDDIRFVINNASKFSPWAAASISKGYITAKGGHRIGICGIGVLSEDKLCRIKEPNAICMRVARDFENISSSARDISGSILIIGPPGSGKTTLLRDLIRQKSNAGPGSISVVDEREEIFPVYNGQACFPSGERTDILSGCSKSAGIEAVLRSMNPQWIAVDEITAQSDCEALLHAGWCGVNLMATAHAGSLTDLKTRPIYKTLIDYKLFSYVLILRRDKSWIMERM
ncbi:MAG: Flp pilus assembly complex ATPase component TadA [Oscillospiraceae bacterium]|nr:Flp pilus assembly complex ATPase component TadA [Oscillospiraceae bacterium]